MEKNILESMRLLVIEAGTDAETILECYTFHISYVKGPGGGKKVASINLSNPSGKEITVTNAKTGIVNVLNCLKDACRNLPTLPCKLLDGTCCYLPLQTPNMLLNSQCHNIGSETDG